MKKFVVILIALLTSGGLFAADQYPLELDGGQMIGDNAIDTYLVDALWAPYSIPVPVYDVSYQGVISGENFYDIDVSLTCLARHPLGECLTPAPLEYRGNGKHFEWNADAGCYMETSFVNGKIHFEAWVFYGPGTRWFTGCFDVEYHPGAAEYTFSKDCALFVFDALPLPEAMLKEGTRAAD